MKCLVVAVTVLGAACGDDGGGAQPDAALPDALTACKPVTTTPLPAGNHKLFLSVDGVTLTKGNCNDSKTNCTALITAGTATVPPLYPNDASRVQNIDVFVQQVQRALAPYSIDVVTTRPSDGDYWMISMGGSGTDIIGANASSVAPALCNANERNGVSLVFDLGPIGATHYASSILSDFGALLGLSSTSKDGDCMCRTTPCNPNANDQALCTYGVDVAVSTANSCGRTTQNEPLMLSEYLGCR